MTLDELKVACEQFQDGRQRFVNYLDTFPAWLGHAISLIQSRDREIEALKVEIRRLNEQLVAQARSDDHPRSQLIAVFEEVAETLKAKTAKPLVGTCDGDLEP